MTESKRKKSKKALEAITGVKEVSDTVKGVVDGGAEEAGKSAVETGKSAVEAGKGAVDEKTKTALILVIISLLVFALAGVLFFLNYSETNIKMVGEMGYRENPPFNHSVELTDEKMSSTRKYLDMKWTFDVNRDPGKLERVTNNSYTSPYYEPYNYTLSVLLKPIEGATAEADKKNKIIHTHLSNVRLVERPTDIAVYYYEIGDGEYYVELNTTPEKYEVFIDGTFYDEIDGYQKIFVEQYLSDTAIRLPNSIVGIDDGSASSSRVAGDRGSSSNTQSKTSSDMSSKPTNKASSATSGKTSSTAAVSSDANRRD